MKQTDLYLKYAEVIKMCQGTALEDTPWLCVKCFGIGFHAHPMFYSNIEGFEFAIAVIENRPVFKGDVLFHKQKGIELTVRASDRVFLNTEDYTWEQPESFFRLGGVTMPCPKEYGEASFGVCISAGKSNSDYWLWFSSEDQRSRFMQGIEQLLSRFTFKS